MRKFDVKIKLVVKRTEKIRRKKVGGQMGGWMDGWMGVKAILRIAHSKQKQNLVYLWLPRD